MYKVRFSSDSYFRNDIKRNHLKENHLNYLDEKGINTERIS